MHSSSQTGKEENGMISKTVKKTILSTILLSGCSAAAPAEVQPALDTLSPQEILERADREDLNLSSYHMNGTDIFVSGSQKEETPFDITVQYGDDNRMYIVSRHSDYWQLMRYHLTNSGHHSAETDQMSADEACFINAAPDGTVENSYFVQDPVLVDDYISIPSVYLYSSNEYRSLELNSDFTEIEVVASVVEQSAPEGTEAVIRYKVNSEYHLVESNQMETGPEQSYTFEKNRSYEGFNENLLNLDRLDALFEKVRSNQLTEGEKLQFGDYINS